MEAFRKTVSAISGAISLFIYISLIYKLYDYNFLSGNKQSLSFVLIMVIAIAVIIIIVSLCKNKGMLEPNYSALKKTALSGLIYNTLTLVVLAFISPSAIFYFTIETIETELDTALYITGFYKVIRTPIIWVCILGIIDNTVTYFCVRYQIDNQNYNNGAANSYTYDNHKYQAQNSYNVQYTPNNFNSNSSVQSPPSCSDEETFKMCPSCYNVISKNSNFCKVCGNKLNTK